MTQRQQDVLRTIRQMQSVKRRMPTYQEIGDELGVDKVTVWEHIHALCRLGLIEMIGNKRKQLRRITPRGHACLPPVECCPHCGK